MNDLQQETLEYLTHSLRLLIMILATLVIDAIGIVSLFMMLGSPVQFAGIGIVMVVLIATMFMMVLARKTDGRARALWEWFGHEFNYPPLDDWEDSLEERGAFSNPTGES